MKERTLNLFVTLKIILKKLIYPKWLKKVDNLLLKNYPSIWATSIHKFILTILYIDIVIVLCISLFPLNIEDIYLVRINIFFITLLISFILLISFASKIDSFEIKAKYINTYYDIYKDTVNFSLYILIFSFLISPIYLSNSIITYKSSRLVSINSLVIDIKNFNNGIAYVLDYKETQRVSESPYIIDIEHSEYEYLIDRDEISKNFLKSSKYKDKVTSELKEFILVVDKYIINSSLDIDEILSNYFKVKKTKRDIEIMEKYQKEFYKYQRIINNKIDFLFDIAMDKDSSQNFFKIVETIFLYIFFTIVFFKFYITNLLGKKNYLSFIKVGIGIKKSFQAFILFLPFIFILSTIMQQVQVLPIAYTDTILFFSTLILIIYIASILCVISSIKVKYIDKQFSLFIFLLYTPYIISILYIIYKIGIENEKNMEQIFINLSSIFLLGIVFSFIVNILISQRAKTIHSLPKDK